MALMSPTVVTFAVNTVDVRKVVSLSLRRWEVR